MIQKIPYLIALLNMVGGVLIAIFFGVNEDFFKGRIQSQLQENPKVAAIADPVARQVYFDREADKNWRYYQRFHFHATGIGAMSLSLLLLLPLLGGPGSLKTAAAYFTSLGGFLYPYVWLFAGIYGPEIGRSAAKARFEVFGYMGGLFLLGIAVMVYQLLRYPLRK